MTRYSFNYRTKTSKVTLIGSLIINRGKAEPAPFVLIKQSYYPWPNIQLMFSTMLTDRNKIIFLMILFCLMRKRLVSLMMIEEIVRPTFNVVQAIVAHYADGLTSGYAIALLTQLRRLCGDVRPCRLSH